MIHGNTLQGCKWYKLKENKPSHENIRRKTRKSDGMALSERILHCFIRTQTEEAPSYLSVGSALRALWKLNGNSKGEGNRSRTYVYNVIHLAGVSHVGRYSIQGPCGRWALDAVPWNYLCLAQGWTISRRNSLRCRPSRSSSGKIRSGVGLGRGKVSEGEGTGASWRIPHQAIASEWSSFLSLTSPSRSQAHLALKQNTVRD